MLKIIRSLLSQIIKDIDTGNSNISESEQQQVIDFIRTIGTDYLSRTEAANYLRISKSTFDNYVKKGIITGGIKRPGITGKLWHKSELKITK